MTPERLHLVVNHLPTIGLAAALIPLLIGVIARHRLTFATGLFMVVLFGSTTGIVMGSGEEAEERFERGLVQPALDGEGMSWLHEHARRAHTASKVAYASTGLGAVALLAVIVGTKVKKARSAGLPLAVLTLLAVSVGVGLLIWTAQAGGMIRHPELRDGPPPSANHTNADADAESVKRLV